MAVLAREIQQWPVDQPKLWPGNPRRGDLPLIRESIEENGFYQPIIVQQSTGYVIAGNHRLICAREMRMPEVPVVVVDVDEDRARRMVLADNRTGDKGTYNTDELVDLLGLFDIDDLAGTGYTSDDVRAILDPPLDLDDPSTDEQMGDLEFRVVVDVRDETQQRELIEKLEAEGFNARPLVS